MRMALGVRKTFRKCVYSKLIQSSQSNHDDVDYQEIKKIVREQDLIKPVEMGSTDVDALVAQALARYANIDKDIETARKLAVEDTREETFQAMEEFTT